jgi:transcriptional regulator with XRE-family HTH domain
MTLADRINELIRSRHGDSANAAAKAMGIAPRTLLDLANGKATNPRADTLQTIASHHRVSTDWLLTGVGEGPDAVDPINAAATESVRWAEFVLELHLKEPAHSALLNLPGMIGNAAATFWPIARRPVPSYPGAETTASAAPRIVEAAALEYRAWLMFFEDWIAAEGKANVVSELHDSVAWLQGRFKWQAYFYFVTLGAKEFETKVARGRAPWGPAESALEDVPAGSRAQPRSPTGPRRLKKGRRKR